MRKLQSVIFFLLCAAVCVMSDVITTRGPEGGTAHIKCPYEQGWETYPKCFYKGIWGHRILVTNTVSYQQIKWTADGKYNLSDDMENRVVTVTISKLTLQDTGTYWCFIDGWGWNHNTRIILTVDRAPSTPSRPLYSTTEPSTDSTNSTTAPPTSVITLFQPSRTVSMQTVALATGSPVVIMVCVGLAVLMLGLFLLLIYKWRKHRKSSRPIIKPDASTQDSIYQTLTMATFDPTCNFSGSAARPPPQTFHSSGDDNWNPAHLGEVGDAPG
ncbi:hypothetical protein DPEC_G00169830 [Dallia pectoralis]|uniref:Uncharacterized protein n=1 Tax=Dallia pectoralis TaxID=75939 RepID=A0ACC2GD45_DALPE|nr:hypothetical protein DPEC_G00169830 [Dallia pectoralis]